jgi:hypothetical protein
MTVRGIGRARRVQKAYKPALEWCGQRAMINLTIARYVALMNLPNRYAPFQHRTGDLTVSRYAPFVNSPEPRFQFVIQILLVCYSEVVRSTVGGKLLDSPSP